MPSVTGATLDGELRHKADRRSYRPVQLSEVDGVLHAASVKYEGSADLVGLTRANALGIIPVGVEHLAPGAQIEVILLD